MPRLLSFLEILLLDLFLEFFFIDHASAFPISSQISRYLVLNFFVVFMFNGMVVDRVGNVDSVLKLIRGLAAFMRRWFINIEPLLLHHSSIAVEGSIAQCVLSFLFGLFSLNSFLFLNFLFFLSKFVHAFEVGDTLLVVIFQGFFLSGIGSDRVEVLF